MIVCSFDPSYRCLTCFFHKNRRQRHLLCTKISWYDYSNCHRTWYIQYVYFICNDVKVFCIFKLCYCLIAGSRHRLGQPKPEPDPNTCSTRGLSVWKIWLGKSLHYCRIPMIFSYWSHKFAATKSYYISICILYYQRNSCVLWWPDIVPLQPIIHLFLIQFYNDLLYINFMQFLICRVWGHFTSFFCPYLFLWTFLQVVT